MGNDIIIEDYYSNSQVQVSIILVVQEVPVIGEGICSMYVAYDDFL
jgi:hypothetical protein